MKFEPLAPLGGYIVLSVLLLALVTFFFVRELRNPGMDDANWVDWARRLGLTVLIVFMGFGPGIMVETTESARANVDVFFVVDRTGSMAAEDYDGNKPRLEGVRADIVKITEMLPGSRFGVISFDSSSARQLPLTTDTNALKIWTRGLSQEMTLYSQGSSLNRVHQELRMNLADAKEKNPQNQQVVIFMTDAEDTTEEQKRESVADIAQDVDAGAVLVYGTEEGGSMLEYNPYAEGDPIYIEDNTQGAPQKAISKADLAAGKALADEVGIGFLHLTGPADLSAAIEGVTPEIINVEGSRVVEVFQLRLWPFAIALAALLTWELSVTVRRAARRVG